MENNGENVTFESGALSKTSEHDHCLPKDTILNGKTDDNDEKITFVAQYHGFLVTAFKVYKSRYFSITRIVYSVCFVIIYTLVWCQMPLTETYIIGRKLALFLLNVHVGFDCICETSGCRTFVLETNKGGACVSHPVTVRVAYMLARMTCETLLMLGHFAPQLIAIYWILGFSSEPGAFFVSMFILLANGIIAQSLGRLIGTVSPLSIGDTVCVANGIMIFISLFAGFIVFSKPQLQYLNYLSYQFYSLTGVFQSEFMLGETAMRCATVNATMFSSCKQQLSDDILANDAIEAFDAIGALIPTVPLSINVIVMLVFPLIVNLGTLAAHCFITRPKTCASHNGV